MLYQPGKGTWFTARCTITADGRMSFDFDYDNEPEWDIDVYPDAYAEDQEKYPRDEEHQPDWLKHKLSGKAKRKRGIRQLGTLRDR